MDYFEWIEMKKQEPEPTERYQRHHIIPRSVGGSNGADNRIKLSYEDHWLAHQMLAEVYPNEKGLQMIAKLSKEDFVKKCEAQAKNTFGWGENGKPLMRTEEWRKRLSLNHISKYDDGSLPYEQKLERYERRKELKERSEIRRVYKEDYENFIEDCKERADLYYETRLELEQYLKELTEGKKYYNDLARMSFNDYLVRFVED